MSFPEFTKRPRVLTVADLVMFVALAALLMAALTPSQPSAGKWLAVPLFPIGVVLWWVAGYEPRGPFRQLGRFIFPAYLLLALTYFVLLVLACISSPRAGALVVSAQFLMLFYVILR